LFNRLESDGKVGHKSPAPENVEQGEGSRGRRHSSVPMMAAS